jgi:putative integral membrane protein (TIGR02587 family)
MGNEQDGEAGVQWFGVGAQFYIDVARAFAGALLFALPLLMTMEMWSLGFVVRPERLGIFLLVGIPLLTGLAWLAGFREDVGWRDALIDAGIAYLVAALAAGAALLLLGAITSDMSWHEIAGKVALQMVPAGMGAVLARSQLGLREEEDAEEARRESYAGELFLMAAGALFLAFNVAPTEEIVLIAHQQASPWYGLALLAVSLLVLHAFVYAVGFVGQHTLPEDRNGSREFLHLTLPGYAVVLLICTYVLWTFGRLEGLPALPAVHLVLVLGFPAALGASTARLVL